MKDHQLHKIRNFAVVGHASAGKTMLCEAMLATAGRIGRMGSIKDGSTVSDYHHDEKEKQVSMHASLLRAEWLETELTMVDTPGSPDFIGDALSALHVADFALIVIHAAQGMGFQTERMWQVATELGIPKILVVNGVDRENSNVDNVLSQIRSIFGAKVFPMSLPLDQGPGCHRYLDAMRSEVMTYKTDKSGKFEEAAASGSDAEKVKALHGQLIEYVAESNDELLEKFFEEGGISEEELRKHLHEAIQAQSFTPLFCTAAETNTGVARLMDFIAKFGSSPIDRKVVTCETSAGEKVEVDVEGAHPVVFVFKTLMEEHVGALSFFRIYSGRLQAGDTLENCVNGGTERIGKILLPNGKDREDADHLCSGEIGALVKLKDTNTNDTLCSAKLKVRLPKIEYPAPSIHAALKSQSPGDEDKIAQGLAQIHREDPAFVYRVDPELKQTILSGQGQLHLESVVKTLKRRNNVDIELVKPKIPYRETIRGKGDSKYRHKKQSGGAGQFAEVWMRIEPAERNSGLAFGHSLVGNNVDRVFVPSVEKGVRACEVEGILAGYRICDLKVDFYDGKQHPVDSKDIAFQIAGKGAFREAFMAAMPHLIEPIVKVTIRVPEESVGNVLGDLSARGGRVMGTDAEEHFSVITALIPQRSIYAYANDLRSLTAGRGQHAEAFSHYEDMPSDVERQVIGEAKKAAAAG